MSMTRTQPTINARLAFSFFPRRVPLPGYFSSFPSSSSWKPTASSSFSPLPINLFQYLRLGLIRSQLPLDMDFFTSSTTASSSSSSSSSSSTSSSTSSGTWGEGGGGSYSSMVSEMVRRVICAIVTCVFAIVGSFVGAVTGALIGLATESGLFRGAGIGAISGAVFSIETVESSLDLWNSNESGIWSILYLMDIISSLLSGRLVRDKVGPAVQSAVQSQMSAMDSPYIEIHDFFETGGTGGMSEDSVDKLPKIKITSDDNVDASGDRICCSVCLQDFQIGETARSLPECRHIFHLPCIDNWLTRHGSCPLCRRDI